MSRMPRIRSEIIVTVTSCRITATTPHTRMSSRGPVVASSAAGRRSVQHRLQIAALHAVQILPGLLDSSRSDTGLTGSPNPPVELAILGLERRPADHAFERVEPETPFLRIGGRDLVEKREIAALVGAAVGSEMKLKECPSARQVKTMQQHVSI